MATADEGTCLHARVAAPAADQRADAPPTLCSGEVGKEYELRALQVLLDVYGSDYYVVPGSVLKRQRVASLVCTDAPMDADAMRLAQADIDALIAQPRELFAGGDVIGVDIVMLPRCPFKEHNALATRAMTKLVEVKSGDRVTASAVGGSLAVQAWLLRRDVRREWLLYSPSPEPLAPLLRAPPSFMATGDVPETGLFCFKAHERIGLTDEMAELQRALREAASPGKELAEAARELRRNLDSVTTQSARASTALAALTQLVDMHDACLRAAEEQQTACRERRTERKRRLEELYATRYAA